MNRIYKQLLALTMVFLLACSLILSALGEQSVWNCPDCGRTGNIGNFCGGCGHPAPWKETAITESLAPISTTVSTATPKPTAAPIVTPTRTAMLKATPTPIKKAELGIKWDNTNQQCYLTVNGKEVSWLTRHEDVSSVFNNLGINLRPTRITDDGIPEDDHIAENICLVISDTNNKPKILLPHFLEIYSNDIDYIKKQAIPGCIRRICLIWYTPVDYAALFKELYAYACSIWGNPTYEYVTVNPNQTYMSIDDAIAASLSSDGWSYILYEYKNCIDLTMWFKNMHCQGISFQLYPTEKTKLLQASTMVSTSTPSISSSPTPAKVLNIDDNNQVVSNIIASDISPTSITIQWTALSDVKGYKVSYRKTGARLWNDSTILIRETEKTFDDLPSNTYHDFRVIPLFIDGSEGEAAYLTRINTIAQTMSPKVRVNNNSPLRSSPSQSGDKIDTIPANTWVSSLGKVKSMDAGGKPWYKVIYNDKEGYISSINISE